jgi:hypothetical protein
MCPPSPLVILEFFVRVELLALFCAFSFSSHDFAYCAGLTRRAALES